MAPRKFKMASVAGIISPPSFEHGGGCYPEGLGLIVQQEGLIRSWQQRGHWMSCGYRNPQEGRDGKGEAKVWESTQSCYDLLNPKCLGPNKAEQGNLREPIRMRENT